MKKNALPFFLNLYLQSGPTHFDDLVDRAYRLGLGVNRQDVVDFIHNAYASGTITANGLVYQLATS